MSTKLNKIVKKLLHGEHACFDISFNDHALAYQTAQEAYDDGYLTWGWISEADRARALKDNTVWSATWCPEVPTGSLSLATYSLSRLIRALDKLPDEDIKND